MNSSKILLGATTCFLAVAAVAASKIQKAFTDNPSYYCTNTVNPLHSKCVLYEAGTPCGINGSQFVCFYYTNPGNAASRKYLLYTNFNNPSTPTCAGSSGVNCTNKITYDIQIP